MFLSPRQEHSVLSNGASENESFCSSDVICSAYCQPLGVRRRDIAVVNGCVVIGNLVSPEDASKCRTAIMEGGAFSSVEGLTATGRQTRGLSPVSGAQRFPFVAMSGRDSAFEHFLFGCSEKSGM